MLNCHAGFAFGATFVLHLHALSSTHRWRDPARQRRSIAVIPFSSSLHFPLLRSMVYIAPSHEE